MGSKLIAIDVDGTLLNDHYEITTRTKKALDYVIQDGIKVVLATGRGPLSCYPIMDELRIDSPIITHNGAVIAQGKKRETIWEVGFQVEEVEAVVQFCRQQGLHFDLNTAFELYVESIPASASHMYEKYFMQPQLVGDVRQIVEPIVKFTIFAPAKELDLVFPELQHLGTPTRVIRSGETFIDMIHPQATKGNALSYLLQQEGIQQEEVIAFGNYFNDLEMLQLAKLGVAMQNAPLEVQRAADLVTASNNEDGVALVLEELLMQIK